MYQWFSTTAPRTKAQTPKYQQLKVLQIKSKTQQQQVCTVSLIVLLLTLIGQDIVFIGPCIVNSYKSTWSRPYPFTTRRADKGTQKSCSCQTCYSSRRPKVTWIYCLAEPFSLQYIEIRSLLLSRAWHFKNCIMRNWFLNYYLIFILQIGLDSVKQDCLTIKNRFERKKILGELNKID